MMATGQHFIFQNEYESKNVMGNITYIVFWR